jgi:hypothetical protein
VAQRPLTRNPVQRLRKEHEQRRNWRRSIFGRCFFPSAEHLLPR